MAALLRAVVYASVFIALLLVFLPARVLEWSGVTRPPDMGMAQLAGVALAAGGGALAVWCVLAFAVLGRGTPAPFDPPRQLVDRGPYGLVRNPMYMGAGVALAGAALFYGSLALLAYTVGFMLVAHAFVVWYEEPALRRLFGPAYDAYCRRCRRWWPAVGSLSSRGGSE